MGHGGKPKYCGNVRDLNRTGAVRVWLFARSFMSG